jgi:CRP-like cAMP-binding protein
MAQVFQSVACNATHSIEQRTAKWLSAAIDRTDDTTMPITQEQLATMLGVGRSYLSRVIHAFKSEGVVETRRGGLVIKDVTQLNRMACECNHSVRDHFDEVLKGIYPAETDAG